MTYHELVQFMKNQFADVDASSFEGHAAYQFNVRGEGEGAFYLEIQDGKIFIEPYEYYDRDVIFECDSQLLIDVAEGKADVMQAVSDGKFIFTGNVDKAVAFGNLLTEAKAKAAKPAKKAEEKPAEEAVKAEPAKETVAAAATTETAASTKKTASKKGCARKNSSKKK